MPNPNITIRNFCIAVQHSAVFVGARLHVSGGALGGGRMVDDGAAWAVLDTEAGQWTTWEGPEMAHVRLRPGEGCSRRGSDTREGHEWGGGQGG